MKENRKKDRENKFYQPWWSSADPDDWYFVHDVSNKMFSKQIRIVERNIKLKKNKTNDKLTSHPDFTLKLQLPLCELC